MKENFSENDLKVFGCFIHPKYPAATRSLKSVVKETGLSEEEVVSTFKEYDNVLFRPVSETKWSFNLVLFMARFHQKYPHLFSEFSIKQTAIGLIMGPKSLSEENVDKALKSIIDDPQQPEELCSLLQSVINGSKEPETLGGKDEVLSFSM